MRICTTYVFLASFSLLLSSSVVVAGSNPQARTESNCNFGMVKGQSSGTCNVPIPAGCTVAKFPGFDQRWTDISKGGKTSCRFDEKKSDWKTTIVGTCESCTTGQCSARFSVMFNCSDNIPQANMQTPIR